MQEKKVTKETRVLSEPICKPLSNHKRPMRRVNAE